VHPATTSNITPVSICKQLKSVQVGGSVRIKIQKLRKDVFEEGENYFCMCKQRAGGNSIFY